VHSWNGKYRRPAGLASSGHDGGYDTAMQGDLLWVYEGLTEYLGEILAPRAGLRSPEDFREALAIEAATLDTTSGRKWRPLEDTAVAAQLLYSAGSDYTDYRRSVDYYPEGTLIWLDADTLIRQLTKGAKSIDDFCRAFHGGPGGAPAMKTYTFNDVVAAMNAVAPYDWAGFFNQRLHSTSPHAPLDGITRSGWKLVYDATRSDFWRAAQDEHKMTDLSFSLGIRIRDDGTIDDVKLDGPAAKAGMAPAVTLVAVNGRAYSSVVIRDALKKATTDSAPIELMIRNGEYYKTFKVDYHGGERYPHLVREDGAPDALSQIIAPKAK